MPSPPLAPAVTSTVRVVCDGSTRTTATRPRRGTGEVTDVPDPAPPPPGGVLREDEPGLLCAAWAPADSAWVVGQDAVIFGLTVHVRLNGINCVVVQPLPGEGRVLVRLRWTDEQWYDAAVRPANLRQPPGWETARCERGWSHPGALAGAVRWLSPDDMNVPGAQMAADFLHTEGQRLWPGRARERGVNVEGAAWPRVRPRDDGARRGRANQRVPATKAQLWTEPMPGEAAWPVSEVIPLEPQKVWDAARPLPKPRDLERVPGSWARIKAWCDSYDVEWRRVLRGRQKGKRAYRFNYNHLSEGGRRGLIIEDFLADEYAGWVWDLREFLATGGDANPNAAPCTPVLDSAPQAQAEWDLAAMEACAIKMGYTDLNMIYELAHVGFRSHSDEVTANRVVMSANYKGFFDYPDFVNEKSEEERTGFTKRRLFGGYAYPPFLNCRLHPRNVATQLAPDGSVIKQRQTVDCAFPRPERGKRWAEGEAISLNDGCPLENPEFFCDVEWASVDRFARGLGVLKAAGLPLGMFKADLRAFFRFMVACPRELHLNVQWVCNHLKMEVDPMLQFGQRPNPNLAQRVQSFILAVVRGELAKEQAAWRVNGKLDAALSPAQRAKLALWERDRSAKAESDVAAAHVAWRAAGVDAPERMEREAKWRRAAQHTVTPWYSVEAYCDDDFSGCFAFFLPAASAVLQRIYDGFNIEMADGRVDVVTGTRTKNKYEESYLELEVLGILLSLEGDGWRRLTEERALAYAREGNGLIGVKFVRTLALQSFIGRLIFSSQALPGLFGPIQRLLASVRQGWSTRDQVRLGTEAWTAIGLATAVLRANEGMALHPMAAVAGAEGRRVIWCFTDAARQPDADFSDPGTYVGYGAWLWPEGSDTVFSASGRWLRGEQEDLDSTALELHVANMGQALAHDVMAAVGWSAQECASADVIMVNDNESATWVSCSLRASSASLRVLIEQRTEQERRWGGVRTLPQHTHRELSEEADDLSKGEFAAFRAKLNARFGRNMKVMILPEPTGSVRSLEPARLAARNTKESAAGASPGARDGSRQPWSSGRPAAPPTIGGHPGSKTPPRVTTRRARARARRLD